PRCFYDLVVEVAIVRTGPIQGDMVHPYLRRRGGEEPVEYPDEAIRRVLGKTLGVPLFQEQAMALAVVAAGFTPGEADELRRAIAAWKRHGNQIARFGEQLEGGMLARGYSRRFATQVFEQIKGFSGYGFPESHAASFALLVYASAWLKRHHPAAFTAALLNSQPMGFYAPSQLVRDAVEHGVAVRAIDVHCSRWDATLERGPDPASWISDAWISDAGISRASCGFGDELDAGIGIGIGIGIGPAGAGDSAAAEVERRSAPRRTAAAGWGGPGVYRLRVAGAPAAPAHPRVRIDGVRIESLGEVAASPDTRANGTEIGIDSDAGGSGGARRWRFLADVFGTLEPPTVDASSAAASSAASSSIDAAVRRLHGRGRSAATAADASIDRVRRPSQDGRTAAVGSASDGSLYFVRTQPAVRLGLRLVRGLDLEEGHRIVEAVARHGPFSRLSDLLEASGVRVAALRRLAAADAFRSMGLDRQQAAWQILALRDRGRALWSFGAVSARSAEAANAEISPPSASVAAADPPEPSLPPIRELSGIARDLESAGVSLRGHPIACLRPKLQRIRVIPCGFLRDERRTPAGRTVSVAGMVLIRQRPSTAKGILFITIEDETGTANLIVRPKTYARLRPALRGSVVLRVRGKVERRDGVAHVIVATAEDMTTAVES
ncbi:MAG: OB-fold nucleic acid binding domain-containing protein, partial [Planctomycetota bacterium]